MQINPQIRNAIAVMDMLKILGFPESSFFPAMDENKFGVKVQRNGKEGVIVIGPKEPNMDYQALMNEGAKWWNSLSQEERDVVFKESIAYSRKMEILAVLVTAGIYKGKQT